MASYTEDYVQVSIPASTENMLASAEKGLTNDTQKAMLAEMILSASTYAMTGEKQGTKLGSAIVESVSNNQANDVRDASIEAIRSLRINLVEGDLQNAENAFGRADSYIKGLKNPIQNMGNVAKVNFDKALSALQKFTKNFKADVAIDNPELEELAKGGREK